MRRGRDIAHFGVIHQVWLREAIKRWSRFRLGAGYSFTTIDSGAQALARWSLFLDGRPEVAGPADIARQSLELFLSWMASSPWGVNTKSHTLTFTKVFLDWGHRHNSLPGLPANAVIYEDEVSRPPDNLPQFIPEFVIAQLESDTNLARLANPTVRHLVIVLMETGIRGGDACELEFNPIVKTASVAPACASTTPRSESSSSSLSTPRRWPPFATNRPMSARCGRTDRRGCSPDSRRIQTAPSPTPMAVFPTSSAAGRPTSTCATRPASASGSTPTSSVTPSGPE